MVRYLKVLLLLAPLACIGALWYILTTSDPSAIGTIGVLCVFILMYITCVSVSFIVLHLVLGWARKAYDAKNASKGSYRPMGARKAYYVATIVSLAPVILLAMRSFSRLQYSDVVLVLLFVGVSTFLVLKRS